jgi:hypothetical protein
MPVTGWEDVAGYRCVTCGGPATHIYGTVYWCCSCHTGEEGGGLFTREEAQREHARVLTRRAEGGGE